LRAWLKRPITRDEVQHDPQGLMRRFVVCAQLFGNAAARSFVLQLGTRLQEPF
jgi:hypothetical protein